ncbi:glycine betaine ABC transporter substrate-binding protein [Domibacillus epiphyticus]|uniref:glycine betaine ABC transporter substrate-binding protein n=1 Tax=Domibacillus epiphyticus TaxID=1714355 RepID=UPI0009F8B168|nr:glycine betaine ABC transporter substrate-binding protein [Domibacillus epiphyticus]
MPLNLIAQTTNAFTTRWAEIWQLIVEHLYISLLSIGLAILISVPLGIYLTRHKKIAEPIIGITAVFQTIPSLALLVFLVPFIGTGEAPAIIALTIYGLLPILRNTYLGITGVDRSTVEAGVGMGMTSRQVLWMVELPLAMKVIMGGVRTATVLIVGVATIAGLIGAGGLGDLIFRGLQTYNSGLILAGAIPAALIAIILDFILKRVEYNSSTEALQKKGKRSRKMTLTLVSAAGLLFIGMAVWPFVGKGNSDDTITITGKSFTEQEILVHVYGKLIEEHTDLDVKHESFISGSAGVFDGLKQGSYDMSVEYTGTILLNYLKEEIDSNDPDKVYDYVKNRFNEEYDLQLLEPIGFNNTYSVTIRQADADKYGINTISELKSYAKNMRFGSEPEFLERADGYPGLQEVYGIDFASTQTLDTGIMYSAIKNNEVDAIDAYTTDGRIQAFNLKVLEDDKQFFPPYYAIPVVRGEVLEAHPELEEVLNMLAGKIDDERMQELNKRVDLDGKKYEEVAEEFLKEEGFIE